MVNVYESDDQALESTGEGLSPADDYINGEDIFFWMEEPAGSDIPLRAIWIQIPTGCRFCC
jgi:hypothetical protein